MKNPYIFPKNKVEVEKKLVKIMTCRWKTLVRKGGNIFSSANQFMD